MSDALERFDCEQNSPEWYECRRGIPTASEFHTVMAQGKKKGEPSITRQKYLYRLVGERITGEVLDRYTNADMERGHVMEPDARNLYALMTDIEPEPCGFLRRCGAGYSPDGLVGNDGTLEIKTKLPAILIDVLLTNEIPPEHWKQIQGGLYIAERDYCDFVCYWPRIKPFMKRVGRDENTIRRIADEVARFNDELSTLEARIRAMAA